MRKSDSGAGESPLPAWRVAVYDLLEELRAILEAARSIDITIANNAYCSLLVQQAVDLLNADEDLRRMSSADDYYGECFSRVQAALMGARDMVGTSASLKSIVAVACSKSEEIAKILDEADLAEARDHLPDPQGRAKAFMEGKALFSDMLEKIDRERPAAEIEARFRKPGQIQYTVAVREALRAVQENGELTEGFAAALTGYLGEILDGVVPSMEEGKEVAIRRLSFEGCVGPAEEESHG